MKRDFDQVAATWDDHEPRRLLSLGIAEAMLAAVPFASHHRVIDFGAGSGLVAFRLSPSVGEVVCADSSTGMLSVIDGKIRSSEATNIRTLALDLEHEAPAEDADVIVSSMTLHHIKDIRGLLRRMCSVVKPGGWIALADLDSEPGDFHPDNTGVEHFGFDRAVLGAMAAEAGFSSVTFTTAYRMRKEVAGAPREFPIFLMTARAQLT